MLNEIFFAEESKTLCNILNTGIPKGCAPTLQVSFFGSVIRMAPLVLV